ncbi:Aste57867_20344 [Aphanomyces stellatus]|uniref:Aste57867_20344 protein n=1 Tax=Aphanomyces stellatus TaxID=120398 RepID=A0A485LER2_9STRA|nr:hypothetical protein As57867_020278 [Aphanomyces stellatus]VFT97031.1 Aste57867_20344 [Aphanomyces stellatus]
MDEIVARHAAQLDHYAVPAHLRETAMRKVSEQDYSAPWAQEVESGKVVTVDALDVEGDIWVLDHVWLFQTAKDAADQLRANAALREDMRSLTDHFAKSPCAVAKGDDNVDALVDWIVVHLVHCAYSIKFGHTASDLYHYVLANLGSKLTCAKDNASTNDGCGVNVQVAPLYFVDAGRLVSLMWATQPLTKGQELVRPHATKISLIQLGKQSYWEARYEEEDEFDWYCGYEHMRTLVKRHVQPTDAVLLAGTGASTLPVDMEHDGFTNIVAMDYAANVVATLQSKYTASAVHFVQADMTQMPEMGDDAFDVILDKGCLDTMLLAPETQVAAGANVWAPITADNAAAFPDASAAMRECMRLLKPNGRFLLFTYGSPTNRMGLLDWPTPASPGFMWEILECLEMSPTSSGPHSITKTFFIYVLQKQRV